MVFYFHFFFFDFETIRSGPIRHIDWFSGSCCNTYLHFAIEKYRIERVCSGVASGRAGRAEHDQNFPDKKNKLDFPSYNLIFK